MTFTLTFDLHWMLLHRYGFHISHVYSLWRDLSVSTKKFDLVTFTLTFDLHYENFNLGHNFRTVIGTAFIFLMCIPCYKTFALVPKFVTVTFDLYFENFNFDHNYWTITDMAFIFHMCIRVIPCDKTFPSVPKY